MASATLKQRSCGSFPQRLRRSGFSCRGRTGAQETSRSYVKPQGHVSPTVTSLLCTSTLLLVHTARITPLLVPVLCLVLSCDQMPDKNNRKKDWFGHRLESSVHHGRKGVAEQVDLCQCSHETERESLQNWHTETPLPWSRAPSASCAS